jgi:hypothetical protein
VHFHTLALDGVFVRASAGWLAFLAACGPSGGTTHLLFEPLEFLEKLAALTPRAEINLVLYHGVLAPQARWRADVVAYRRAERTGTIDPSQTGISIRMGESSAERPRKSIRVTTLLGGLGGTNAGCRKLPRQCMCGLEGPKPCDVPERAARGEDSPFSSCRVGGPPMTIYAIYALVGAMLH